MLKERWKPFKRPAGSNAPTTVLVVDDEEPVRRFVSLALTRAGYQVTVAADGPEALTLAETAEPFELLVTDLMMPGITGDELARQLRQRWTSLRVLYLTGHADRLFAARLALWGREAFLDKPCLVKALLEAASLLMFNRLAPVPSPAPSAAPAGDARTMPAAWRKMRPRSDWAPDLD